MTVNELEEEKYEREKADKKQRELNFMTEFLLKNIDYTLHDTENAQKENNKKAIGATK